MTDSADCGPECQEALREIERLIDGELDPVVRGEVVEHLSDCSPCMQHAEFRRSLKEFVHDRCRQDDVPEALRTKIEGLLRDPSV
jgi:mycothiol system anti-sigma-R factor